MKRVTTAALLILLVLIAVHWATLWLLILLTGVVAFIAIHEYLLLGRRLKLEPLFLPTFLFSGVLFAVTSYHSMANEWVLYAPVIAAVSVTLLLPLFLAASLTKNVQSAFLSGLYSWAALPFIALPLLAVASMRMRFDHALLVLFLFSVVWLGDIAALYVGRAIGTHKLAPSISPNKSWEGALASAVAAVAAGFAFGFLFQRSILKATPIYWRYVIEWVIAALGANVMAQFGDLAESALKRAADVKDSGALLPGHGGMLDRIDALLFAAPVVWVFAFFTYHW